MSQFVGAAQQSFVLCPNDPSTQSVRWTVVPYVDPFAGYRTLWWPRGNALFGDSALDVSMLDAVAWERFEIVGGASSRVGFVGTTRDQFGTPLPGCTVQLFRTSDDCFIMESVSDTNGDFLLQSWYTPDTHYIVAYKPGSPDVFGTTLNTLVGA